MGSTVQYEIQAHMTTKKAGRNFDWAALAKQAKDFNQRSEAPFGYPTPMLLKNLYGKAPRMVESVQQLSALLTSILRGRPDGLGLSNVKATVIENFGLQIDEVYLGFESLLQLLKAATVAANFDVICEGRPGHLTHRLHLCDRVAFPQGTFMQGDFDKAMDTIKPAAAVARNKASLRQPVRKKTLRSIVGGFPLPVSPKQRADGSAAHAEQEFLSEVILSLSCWHAHMAAKGLPEAIH